MLLHS